MNKDIIIVNQSSGYLMIDIVNAFAKSEKYENVILISGEDVDVTHLNENVIVKTITAYNRSSIQSRVTSWIKAILQILLLIKKHKHYDVFFVSNPPIISFLWLFFDEIYATLIYDVYPDSLLGTVFLKKRITEKNLLYRIWVWNNIKFYSRCRYIYTIGNGMSFRLSKYTNKEIEIIPIWPSKEFERPVKKEENSFLLKNELQDYFIVMYSGNIGLMRNVDVLVDLAELLQFDKRIKFIVIGEGGSKKAIMKLANIKQLNNICFFTWQPYNLLNHSLSAADIAYVSLDEKSVDSIPSKTYNLVKLNIPLLAVVKNDTEIYDYVTDNNLGRCFEKDNLLDIMNYILEMKNNKKFYCEIKNNLAKCSKELLDHSYLYVK